VLLQALFDEVYEVHFRDSGMPETARQAAAAILEGVWRSSEALKTEPGSAFAEAARRSIRDVVEPRSQ